MKWFLFGLLGLVLAPASASAYCSKPTQSIDFPDGPSSLGRPSVPYCLSKYKYSGKHTCEDEELSSYQRDKEEYMAKLNDYVRATHAAAEEAASYAAKVSKYAQCEADEISSQHN
jgi:hypothetical protein